MNFVCVLLDEISPESRRKLGDVQRLILHQLLNAEPLQRQFEIQDKPFTIKTTLVIIPSAKTERK